MAGRFEGKIVLITGASAGIGRATALGFAREGARALALSRSAERLATLEAEARPGVVVPIVADVTDPRATENACRSIERDQGVPDVVVANAGVGLDARFVDTSDEAWRRVFEVNVLGVVRVVRPFVGGMIARGSGRVLIVSSVVGKRGIPHYSAYAASKHALHGMAESLRAEIWGSGVTVGIVCPSSTTTEFQERMERLGPSQQRVRLQRHSAESVARAILRMAASRRREMVLSPEGKAMVWSNVFAPGLLDRILHKVLVTRK